MVNVWFCPAERHQFILDTGKIPYIIQPLAYLRAALASADIADKSPYITKNQESEIIKCERYEVPDSLRTTYQCLMSPGYTLPAHDIRAGCVVLINLVLRLQPLAYTVAPNTSSVFDSKKHDPYGRDRHSSEAAAISSS